MASTTWAVIVAGGRSDQLAPDVDTAFVNLGSKPVITYSLSAYEQCPDVDAIAIVAPKDRVENLRIMLQMFGCYKVKKIIPGGAQRQASVLSALRAIENGVSVVSIHDSARPCVTVDQISETIKVARKFGCGIIGRKITDTIKLAGKGNAVVENVDAGNLWATATPQAFKYEIVVKALEAAQKKRKTLQDESEAMALIKQEVRIVPTTKPTLKIVVPSDIHTAEWLLRR